MDLQDGTSASLASKGLGLDIATHALNHMLQALDYLAMKNIVHRDVKPENILYTASKDSGYQFVLADFGLCSRGDHRVETGVVGTGPYIAPEIINRGHYTSKADVWSLFVTMLWIIDFGGFRRMAYQLDSATLAEGIYNASLTSIELGNIREMAILNPDEHASAAQMLIKCFGGQGLSSS